MQFLADTQVLLWYASDSKLLSSFARQLISHSESVPTFSIESIREIGIKAALGRSDFGYSPREVYDFLVESGWQELPITIEHVVMLQSLPLLHRDPFDRMLVAQAKAESLPLVTADRVLSAYNVATIAADSR